jgi:nucleoside-diphosphate-sugar epimerase
MSTSKRVGAIFGFEPKTPIEEGLPRFVAWYRDDHGL